MAAFGYAWRPVSDTRVQGPGTVVIDIAPNHTDSPRHLDLDFVLNVGRPAETTVSDCISGIGHTVEEARRQAVEVWSDLTASAVMELLDNGNRHATHYRGDDPFGFPGWHCITSGLIGWSGGPDPAAVQEWALGQKFLAHLAPDVITALDRPRLNGVKILFGGSGEYETAEVRVNGRYDPHSSATLASMDWPRLPHATFARMFFLLVHPE